MDYGVEKKVIDESTRINLLGNVLVLIAGKDSKIDYVSVIDDADSVSADGGAVSADAGSASADAGHLSDLKPERSARQG
jgi:molybdate transport system substrate-binding protein